MYTLTMLYEEINETKTRILDASAPELVELFEQHHMHTCTPEWLDMMETRLANDTEEYTARGGKRKVTASMGEVQTRITQLREHYRVHPDWGF